jgi:thioredoxin reductase
MINVRGTYDVVVCGAGPAGIGAALVASRQGASTLLIEQLPTVGGNLTNGYVTAITGFHGYGTFAGVLIEHRYLDAIYCSFDNWNVNPDDEH